jgi:hypothetical protein
MLFYVDGMTLADYPERKNWMVRKHGARVRELHGVSAKSIADELGLQERTVTMIQRKLGLRACRQPGRESCD